jgi:hypothetical protein
LVPYGGRVQILKQEHGIAYGLVQIKVVAERHSHLELSGQMFVEPVFPLVDSILPGKPAVELGSRWKLGDDRTWCTGRLTIVRKA